MIRTRFAPSPTGSMHIGSLRTALFAYALARHDKGKFLLRIEDTDKKREVPKGEELIQETLKTFGISWDEYYVQSERLPLYKKMAERLVKEGHAYEDEGAIRIKIPKDEKISYRDFVLGKEISWETNTLKDLVLLKSDGYPTYHLAVVVDDNDMGITHVLRGHDWLPSTPLHLLLYKFLGFKLPEIGHLTDILDPQGGKLSKRKGTTSCKGLIEEGYLPEAILNFVMLLGWAPKDNRELFTLEEFIKAFDAKGLQKANPIFNREKLDWFNQQYMQKLSEGKFVSYVSNASIYRNEPKFQETVAGTATFMPSRMTTLSDYDKVAGFFFRQNLPDQNLFTKDFINHLVDARVALEKIDNWNKENIDKALLDMVARRGYKTGDFFMDLRVAIAGSRFTPPINDSIAILGKEETLKRLELAS